MFRSRLASKLLILLGVIDPLLLFSLTVHVETCHIPVKVSDILLAALLSRDLPPHFAHFLCTVLMVVDKLTEFFPSESPTSIVVIRAVVHWSEQRGVPL